MELSDISGSLVVFFKKQPDAGLWTATLHYYYFVTKFDKVSELL